MTETSRFAIKTVHPRVARYLKCQEKRIQRQFWETLEHISAGPFPVDDPAHIAHLKGPLSLFLPLCPEPRQASLTN